MRRVAAAIARGLLGGAAWLSALLFALAVLLWVRSYTVAEAWIWGGRHPQSDRSLSDWSLNCWSSQGGLGIYWEEIRYGHSSAGRPSPAPTWFKWATDRMQTYPYVPIPQLARGSSFQFLGITLFADERSYDPPSFDGATGASPGSFLARSYAAVVPYPLLAAATVMLPLAAVIRWARRRRKLLRERTGLCSRCGYDLRASAGRCPECGQPRPAREI